MQGQVQRDAGTATGSRLNIQAPFLASYLVAQAAQSEMLAVACRGCTNAVVVDLNVQGLVMTPHTQLDMRCKGMPLGVTHQLADSPRCEWRRIGGEFRKLGMQDALQWI
jgi:hypothetical protein